MIDLVDKQFVDKCWRDLTEWQGRRSNSPMGEHNEYLLDEFLSYGPVQRSVAEYVLKVYSHTASAHRSNDNETQWRAGIAISLLVSSTVFLLEYQRLTQNDILTGVMTAIGASFCIALGIYIGFHHRITKWWRREAPPSTRLPSGTRAS